MENKPARLQFTRNKTTHFRFVGRKQPAFSILSATAFTCYSVKWFSWVFCLVYNHNSLTLWAQIQKWLVRGRNSSTVPPRMICFLALAEGPKKLLEILAKAINLLFVFICFCMLAHPALGSRSFNGFKTELRSNCLIFWPKQTSVHMVHISPRMLTGHEKKGSAHTLAMTAFFIVHKSESFV